MNGSSRGRLFTVARFAVAAALLTYLATSGALDWSALRRLTAAWPILLIAAGVLLVDLIVTSWRLTVLLRPRGFRMSVAASTRLSLIGVFFNLFLPGGGGDLVRIFYAASDAVGRRTEVAAIVLLDRLFGFYGMLLFALILAPFFAPLIGGSAGLTALVWFAAALLVTVTLVGAVGLSRRTRESRLVAGLLARMPLGGYATRVLDTVQAYRSNGGVIAAAVGISLLAHALSVAIMLLLAQLTAAGGARPAMAFLSILGFMANSLPITPGGLGVGEAAFDSLFALAGFDGGAEAVIGWRLLTLILAPAGLLLYLRGRQQFVRAAPDPA